MGSGKAILGIVFGVLPILYCGGLAWYFFSMGGTEGFLAPGLGPTILGLGAIGLLLLIPLIVKIVRTAAGGGAPAAPGKRAAAAEPAEESGFDADAALARYMARKSAGQVSPPPVQPGEGLPVRPGFGRKIV